MSGVTGDLGTERTSVAAELREIEMLVGSTRSEVGRAQAREDQAAQKLVELHGRDAAPDEILAAAEEHAVALERRATMAVELASLEAKRMLLGRLDAVLAVALRQLPAAGAPAGPSPAPADAVLDETRLLRAVVATQEEERRRIARAVHDGPAQAMANVVLQSEISERVFQVDPGSSKAELAALRTMVNKTLQELRGFIFELRPMILDDLGVVPTLRRYIQTVVDKHGVKVDFTSTGRDRRLQADDEVAIFRLVQDALVERVLRAEAKNLALALDWREEALEIRLQSDGRESASAGEPSAGLTRSERLGLLGGESAQEVREGSVVLTFRLPMTRAPELIT